MKYIKMLTALPVILLFFTACNSEPQLQTPTDPPEYDMAGFAKGADVSWLTEMEKAGMSFYNANDQEEECMHLLRELGMNSIRLRVWVDPVIGWCNKQDVLVKAWRAKQLGMRIMIDFHYSDSWADPGVQEKPAAWVNLSFDELKTAVANHTTEVLNYLKENDITPEWVQVGNETGNGMLWEEGKASDNMAQYAALNNAGYDAIKAVFPEALVIVHIQNGYDNGHYRWLFDGLKNNGGKWDVIGMSLYPSVDDWETLTSQISTNMNDMISRYGSLVMVCETGMPWTEAEIANRFLTDLIEACKAIENDQCLGVFYWEPQSYNGWKSYSLGAFDNSGKATIALDAFAN
ncbi:MAG: glycosyl hydrolase 53 family protein [Bacteroidales bacterium]|jgi:arabinogalactan endo-1,4-beta-galactosidase|nr:glycosyl hydrolase 53 family protein [Bacteroidales bacterium]